jgi:hypothetical protein
MPQILGSHGTEDVSVYQRFVTRMSQFSTAIKMYFEFNNP